MRHFSGLLLLLSLLWAPFARAESASGVIVMDVDLSHQPVGESVQLWIPYPVSDRDQTISDIAIKGDFAESGVYTDAVFSTPVLYARWEPEASSRTLQFSFRAERVAVQRPELRPDPAVSLDETFFARYLAPTSLCPLDDEVRALAELITDGLDGVLPRAQAIYDWTVQNTYRNPETRGCGAGDIHRLLQDPGGKCADISSIFVTLARAAGVPAREVFGIRLGKTPVQDISTWQHCWAEFYLPGQGWISVDPADVRKKMLVEDLELADPETRASADFFWGNLDPYRVKLGEGRDLELNPAPRGEPLNYLMYPFAQVGDTTLDWLDPETFRYTITAYSSPE